jgi:hypothetical protein
MSGMIGLARRGSIASSRQKGVSVSYASFPTKPAGIVDVAITAGAGASLVSSNVLTEGNSSTTNGNYFSAAVFPNQMGTNLYIPRVRNANRASSDRGIGCGMANSTGTSIVYFIVCGNSTSATIQTWVGGVRATQVTQGGIFSSSNSDWLSLVPTMDAGYYRYTVHKNGSATALTWHDTGSVIGVPGKYPCAAFRHTYSFGQFVSPGILALEAADI